jgi:hypothetical protein
LIFWSTPAGLEAALLGSRLSKRSPGAGRLLVVERHGLLDVVALEPAAAQEATDRAVPGVALQHQDLRLRLAHGGRSDDDSTGGGLRGRRLLFAHRLHGRTLCAAGRGVNARSAMESGNR